MISSVWLYNGREKRMRWSDELMIFSRGPLFWYQPNLSRNRGRESINGLGSTTLYYKMANLPLTFLRNYKWSLIYEYSHD